MVRTADCQCEDVCRNCMIRCCGLSHCRDCACIECSRCPECCVCRKCKVCDKMKHTFHTTDCGCGEMCDDCAVQCNRGGCTKGDYVYCRNHITICTTCDECTDCCSHCIVSCNRYPSTTSYKCMRCSNVISLCTLHTAFEPAKVCKDCSIKCKGCNTEFHGNYKDYKPDAIDRVCKNWYRSVDFCLVCRAKVHTLLVHKNMIPIDAVVDLILSYLPTERKPMQWASTGEYESATKRAKLAHVVSSQIRTTSSSS